MMRTNRLFALGATLLVALAACSSTGASSAPSTAASAAPTTAASVAPSVAPSVAASEAPKADIRIGSDNFYESKLMAELYAQALEAAGYTVTRSLGLGSRQDRAPAFEAGQVDLVPEYVGSGLGYYNKQLITGDGETNRSSLQAIYAAKGGLATVLGITPGEDTNAAVVRKDTADTLKLTKMSELAAVQDQLRWGLPPDCDANPLCKGALEAYGITYPPKQREALAACDAPIATALAGQRHRLRVAVLHAAGHRPERLRRPGGRPRHPAGREHRAGRPQRLPRQGGRRPRSPPSWTPSSAKMTTEELTKLGVKVGVDNEDVGGRRQGSG